MTGMCNSPLKAVVVSKWKCSQLSNHMAYFDESLHSYYILYWPATGMQNSENDSTSMSLAAQGLLVKKIDSYICLDTGMPNGG